MQVMQKNVFSEFADIGSNNLGQCPLIKSIILIAAIDYLRCEIITAVFLVGGYIENDHGLGFSTM